MKKPIFILFIAVMIVFSLCGCAGSGKHI